MASNIGRPSVPAALPLPLPRLTSADTHSDTHVDTCVCHHLPAHMQGVSFTPIYAPAHAHLLHLPEYSHLIHDASENSNYVRVNPPSILSGRLTSLSAAGPSNINRFAGPFSPFASSLDVPFVSTDPSQNIFTGDRYLLNSHLNHHGIPTQRLSVDQARQAILYHLLSSMCAITLPDGTLALLHVGCRSLGGPFLSPRHMAHAAYSIVLSALLLASHLNIVSGALGVSELEVLQVLSAKCANVVDEHGAANPLSDIFDRVEIIPKAALIALAALHGVEVGANKLPAARSLVADHLAKGNCGLHKTGYRHLGCASLLSQSPTCNANLHVSNMDLEDSITVNFDLAQLNILASVMSTLNKRLF